LNEPQKDLTASILEITLPSMGLSADPFVQEPGNSQSLNRYSYCINNPLAFTDPTGFGFWGSLWRSIKNSSVIRIAIGVVVAIAIGVTICLCLPVGLSLGQIAMAAAIGGATTAGIGLAAGVGWKQALFEGVATFAISAGVLYAGAAIAGGGLSPLSASGGASGVSLGIGIPLEIPGGGVRAPQGNNFPDPSLHNSSNDADPLENNNHFQDEMPKKSSDRSDGNYGNGAGTSVYSELHSNEHTFAQRCEFCWNGLKHDPVAQASFALTISAIPFPKGSKALGSINLTTLYSTIGHKLMLSESVPNSIKSMLKTDSSLIIGNTRTTNIPRWLGRVALPVTSSFLASYSITRMGRCIAEKWDQSEE